MILLWSQFLLFIHSLHGQGNSSGLRVTMLVPKFFLPRRVGLISWEKLMLLAAYSSENSEI